MYLAITLLQERFTIKHQYFIYNTKYQYIQKTFIVVSAKKWLTEWKTRPNIVNWNVFFYFSFFRRWICNFQNDEAYDYLWKIDISEI